MDFREAMDELGAEAAEVAEAFGLSAQTVRQMRLEPTHSNYRRPPENWPTVLAALAERRGSELDALKRKLQRLK